MKNNIILVFGFILLMAATSSAQRLCKVSGWVFDSLTLKPVQDAYITIEETNTGTTTNSSGYFEMKLPVGKKYTIVFSHIIYDKAIRELNLSKYMDVEYRIYLKERVINIPEIIIKNKKSFDDIRSKWLVSGKELERYGGNNLEKALIYMSNNIVYTNGALHQNGRNYNFTLYLNGKWEDGSNLEEIDPANIQYIEIWKSWRNVDMGPISMPLREGEYTISVVTKN